MPPSWDGCALPRYCTPTRLRRQPALLERDRARVIHQRAVGRAPGDDLPRLVVDQLGLPRDPRPRRTLDRPARARPVQDLDALDVSEQPGQILEGVPDVVDARRRRVDDDGLVDLHAEVADAAMRAAGVDAELVVDGAVAGDGAIAVRGADGSHEQSG